jgi:hypothetical protein
MIKFTLKSDLPIQDITHEELLLLSKINNKSVCEPNLINQEELLLGEKLKKQHTEFRKYVYENFDFQIFYEEFHKKKKGLGLKKQFTVYAKVPVGWVTRDVYYFYNRKTWFNDKYFEDFHEIMRPILNVCWKHLKIKNVQVYDPRGSNIRMRNPSWTKYLSILPTLNPNDEL